RQPDLQRDRAGLVAVLAQPRRDLLRQREDLAQELGVVVEIAVERLLVAHRLRRLLRDDRPEVTSVREIDQILRVLLADEPAEDDRRRRAEIADRLDPEPREHLHRLLTDAPQRTRGQRLEE